MERGFRIRLECQREFEVFFLDTKFGFYECVDLFVDLWMDTRLIEDFLTSFDSEKSYRLFVGLWS